LFRIKHGIEDTVHTAVTEVQCVLLPEVSNAKLHFIFILWPVRLALPSIFEPLQIMKHILSLTFDTLPNRIWAEWNEVVVLTQAECLRLLMYVLPL